VLRRIFGTLRKEVAGGWRRLQNEELRNFYASPNIISVIKSRTFEMSGTCGVHRVYENCIQNSGQKTCKGRDHSEDLGINGMILEWILK